MRRHDPSEPVVHPALLFDIGLWTSTALTIAEAGEGPTQLLQESKSLAKALSMDTQMRALFGASLKTPIQ